MVKTKRREMLRASVALMRGIRPLDSNTFTSERKVAKLFIAKSLLALESNMYPINCELLQKVNLQVKNANLYRCHDAGR